MSEWQPMQTAPKDGTEILVLIGGKGRVVRWVPSMKHQKHGKFPWVCQSGGNAWREDGPERWMPIPPHPSESEKVK